MKLVKILLTPPIIAISVALCSAANAADRFVSTSGEWKLSDDGVCYTDLQTAVNEAQAGETVWLQDGFVCETGMGKDSITGYGYPRIDVPNKVITIRSESGEVDLDAGKGAYIRGAKDPESTFADGRGANAIRPLWVRNSNTVIMGLVLENGSTGDHHNYGSGGAIYGACIVSNCLLRNNFAYCGGAIRDSGTKLYNCKLINNTGYNTGYGGGAVFGAAQLYDCLLEGNSSVKNSGEEIFCLNDSATVVPVYSNCVFRNNAKKGSTCLVFTKDVSRAQFYDCKFYGNASECVHGKVELRHCTFYDNSSLAARGNFNGLNLDTAPILVDCVVSNNTAAADGGAVFGCTVRDSFFTNNWVTGSYNGGAASQCVLEGCTIIDCRSSNNGGAVNASSLTNCFIANCTALYGGGVSGNSTLYGTVISNCYASGTGYGGGAIIENEGSKFAAYDSVFVGNSAIKSGGAIYGINKGTGFSGTFSNCQFIANSDSNTAGAVYYNQSGADAVRVTFTDCEFRDNKSTGGGVGALRGLAYCRGCTFADNVSTNGSDRGGAVRANVNNPTLEQMVVLENCVVSNNFVMGEGGGVYGCIVRGGRIVNNTSTYNGGGAHTCFLSDCEIVGNSATNWVESGNSEKGKGGGLYGCSATNCVIAGNRTWARNMAASCGGGGVAYCNLYNCAVTNNWSAYRSAAVHNTGKAYVCYNCLIVGNHAAAQGSGYNFGYIITGEEQNSYPVPENQPQFYNCTIADNMIEGNYYAICAAGLHNCIVWGNSGKGDLHPDRVPTADHTCQKDLTPGTDDKNLNCNPKLTADYRPGYPVKNKGLYYPWMDDENDVRSKDLAGGPRILGAAPDLGCYEPPIPGLMLLVK